MRAGCTGDFVLTDATASVDVAAASANDQSVTQRPLRRSWAEFMRRIFALDVMQCPRCGGRMRIIAAIVSETATHAILESHGLDDRAPPVQVERPHYELEAY